MKPWSLDRSNGFQLVNPFILRDKDSGALCALPRVAQLERGPGLCQQRGGPLFLGLLLTPRLTMGPSVH